VSSDPIAIHNGEKWTALTTKG